MPIRIPLRGHLQTLQHPRVVGKCRKCEVQAERCRIASHEFHVQMYVFDDETEKTLLHYEYSSSLIRCCILDELYTHRCGCICSIVTILPKTTYVYNLKDGTLYDQYSTYSNPRGRK